MDHLTDFRIYYNRTIHPQLMRLDRQRRRLLRLMIVSTIALIALIIFEIYINVLLLTLVLAIPVGLYITYLFYQYKKFRLNFKPQVVNLILEFMEEKEIFRKATYQADKSVALQQFMSSNLFGVRPAIYQGEDYIEGKIDDVEFEMSELNVREFSRVRSRLNYVFRGIFLHAELKRPLHGSLILFPREFREYLLRPIKFFLRKGAKDMDGFIKNNDFRNTFLTYATENVRLKEVLPEELQMVFLNYVKNTDRQIYVSFQKKSIYIAITNHKDILEPHLLYTNTNFELIYEFYSEINTALKIVRDFDRLH